MSANYHPLDTVETLVAYLARAKEKAAQHAVAIADIESQISAEFYLNGFDLADSDKALRIRHNDNRSDVHMCLMTICVLVMNNGHTVLGESYCANPAKFSAETGRAEARKCAIDRFWPSMVYEQRNKLALPVIDQATLNPKE